MNKHSHTHIILFGVDGEIQSLLTNFLFDYSKVSLSLSDYFSSAVAIMLSLFNGKKKKLIN